MFFPEYRARRLRRTEFNITVGYPFFIDDRGEKVTRDVRTIMTREVMYQLAAILPPEYRGHYSNLEAASETYLRFPPGSQSNLARAGTFSPTLAPAPARG